MTGAWTLVKAAVKAPKPAPKKAKFGGAFNAGTIVAGLSAWGTESSVRAVKVQKPAPVAPWATAKHAAERAARKAATAAKRAVLPAAVAVTAAPSLRKEKKSVAVAPAAPASSPKPKKRVSYETRKNMTAALSAAIEKATRHVAPKVERVNPLSKVLPAGSDPQVVPAAAPVDPSQKGYLTVRFGDIAEEVKRDAYVVAHCTSADWDAPKRSSAGVAKVILESSGFDKPYPLDVVKDNLLARQSSDDRVLYTLLTKDEYFGKPTFGRFAKCVTSLRNDMLSRKEKSVVMPLIGCGRDNLPVGYVLLTVQEELINYGINVMIVSDNNDTVQHCRSLIKSSAAKPADTKWVNALRNGLREFTDRPVVTYERERKLAKKMYTNDRVLARYSCSCEGGGSLNIMLSDIRHAMRDNVTTVAVATSRDWKSEGRGKFAPASYLYTENGYPKPTQDDLVNSRLAYQEIGDKSIFTLFTKDKEAHYPKLADYRRCLLELALGLDLVGKTEITIPALGMDRDKVQYETGLNSILELLCSRGIKVNLLTTSKSQFFTMKALLSKYSQDADVWATDNSTPASWQPRLGDQHYHKCYSCEVVYSHWHKHHNKDHPQFDKQCPNKHCVEYHGGKNPTNSQKVDNQAEEPSMEVAIQLLQNPEWIREASVFPAAIESVWSSVAKYLPVTAEHIFPKVIPDNTAEEVIQLKRLGYAGAVETKPKKVKVWQYSQMIGLAEIKPRPPKPIRVEPPHVPTAHERKNFATREQQPIKPAFCSAFTKRSVDVWLSLTGCTSRYQDAYFRMGTSRHQNKKLAKRGSEYLRYGWHESSANRFSSLLMEDIEDVVEYVDEVVTAPCEGIKQRKVKPVKRTFNDDAHWALGEAPPASTEPIITRPRAKRDVKASKVSVAHLTPQSEVSCVDLIGEVSSLNRPTTDLTVFNLADNTTIKVVVNDTDHNMLISRKIGDLHHQSITRTFRCAANLQSGSPIYNSLYKLSSLVTMSDYDGTYAVISNSSKETQVKCSGESCPNCQLEVLLKEHKPKNKGKKNNRVKSADTRKQMVPAPSNAQMIQTTTSLAKLVIRAEKLQQDVNDVSSKVSNIKKDSAEIKRSASNLATNVGAKNLTIGTKSAKKKKPVAKGGFSLTKYIPSTSLIVMFLLALLTCASANCFDGHAGSRFISGVVKCHLNTSINGPTYLHDSILHHSANLIESSDEDLINWYNAHSAVVDVLAPCFVTIDKEANVIAIDDYVVEFKSTESSNNGSIVLIGLLLILVSVVLCFIRRTNRRVVTKERRPTGPVYNKIVTSCVLLSLISLTVAPPPEKTPSQMVTDAKLSFDNLSAWFNAHKTTISTLKEHVVTLNGIRDTLKNFGARDDPAQAKVAAVLKDWNSKVSAMEAQVAKINTLERDIADLKAKIAEMDKSNRAAGAAFEEFKSRFARSVELEEHGNLEDLTEEELNAVQVNLESRKRDLYESLSDYEKEQLTASRSAREGSLPGEDPQIGPAYDVVSSTNTPVKRESNDDLTSSNQANAQSNSDGEALACWKIDSGPSTAVVESDIKVKFGVNSNVNCDSSGFQWCLYKDWQTCQTHGPQKSAIGLGWDECAIGRTTFHDKYYIAKKNNDDAAKRSLCTASCFALDDIIRAIRNNFSNGYCTWPLILSGHWDVSSQVSNLTNLVTKYVSLSILKNKLVVLNSDDSIEFDQVSKDVITSCCNGYLATGLGDRLSFYDGPCLCVANDKNVERRIKDALVDKYNKAYQTVKTFYSLKAVGTAVVVIVASIVNPFLGLFSALTFFVANAYADCSLKNFHTLYVGDSSSKQIYTSLYMEKGDCFTLGENTFELLDVDDTYAYKQTEKYPSSLTALCTDIDWGCGLSEGSKVCEGYNKDCKTKCDNTAGAIYKTHCLATTTFHNDGCYGFLVQDHSVSVHGGICLLTNASKPYTGYSKFERSESRKLKFKVSSFDQSKEIIVNLADMIYSEAGFTIQDLAIQRDRIPTHMVDAGQILCSYTDNSGNDFCHSVNDDTSKLSNRGCVSLDWTFLADEQRWKIEDTSAIITPYLYDLYEVCDFDSMKKDGKVISVKPTGMLVSFKIDSDFKCSAFTTTRCKSVNVISVDTSPGFVELVQATWIKVQVTSNEDCYVSLKTSACNFISHNYCKVGKDSVVCRWVVYCAAVMDVTATIIGDNELNVFNFTSGKQSFPTLEYSRTAFSEGSSSTSGALSSVATAATKVLSYVPGYDFIKSIFNFSIEKYMIPILCVVGAFISLQMHSLEGIIITGLVLWVYLFTSFVHALDDAESDESGDIRLWHLIAILFVGSIDWCKLCVIVYTFLCRRCSGIWNRYNLSNPIIGMPAIDWAIWLLSILLCQKLRLYILICSAMHSVIDNIWWAIRRPQSTMFNTEVLNHSPIASLVCKYVSRASESSVDSTKSLATQIWQNSTSVLTISHKTSFISEVGTRMFNSPPSTNGDTEDMTIEELEVDDGTETVVSTSSEENWQAPEWRGDLSDSIYATRGSWKSVLKDSVTSIVNKVMKYEPTDNSSIISDSEDEYETALANEASEANMARALAADIPALVVSEAGPSNRNKTKKRSPSKERVKRINKRQKARENKNLSSEVVSIVLHKLLWKHAPSLIREFTRSGRYACLGVDTEFDAYIICEPTDEPKGRIIKVTVKPHPAHCELLKITPKELRAENALFNTRCTNRAEHVEVANTQIEEVITKVVKSVIPDYSFKHYGSDLKRYYLHVPHCAGFEQLDAKSFPQFVIIPLEAKTADEMKDQVRTKPATTILILGTRQNVPKEWVRVVTLYVRDKKLTRKTAYETESTLDQREVIDGIKALDADKTAVSVKDVPSLVNSVFAVGNTCRKRQEDILSIQRPSIFSIKELVNTADTVNVHCTYYATKLAEGDFIKLSVGPYNVSIYKSALKDFVIGSNRTFLVFRHKVGDDNRKPSYHGQLSVIWKAVTSVKFSEGSFCEQIGFGSNNNTAYVVPIRESPTDWQSIDYINKGIKLCGMNAETSDLEHIYVALPDDDGKKMTNAISSAIIQDLVNRNIEVTILCGKTNDVQIVTRHIHSALRLLSGGEEITFNTSLDLKKESNRKDIVRKDDVKLMKTIADVEHAYEFSFKFKEGEDSDTLFYCRGKVEREDWRVIDTEQSFQALVQTLYSMPAYMSDRRRQIWLCNAKKGEVVGLLPSETLRPAHFGIRFIASRNYGKDVIGYDTNSESFAPLCGSKDKYKRCTYRTYPMIQHGGGTATGIYTTELKGHIGKPFVFSKNRLMSGCQVYITPKSMDANKDKSFHSVSSGFITTCSASTLLGVQGFIHPLEDFNKLRMVTAVPENLNSRLRVSLNRGKVEECFASTFNPTNINLSAIGRIPNYDDDEIVCEAVETSKPGDALDPLDVKPEINIADQDEEVLEPWWAACADFSFVEKSADVAFYNSIPAEAKTLLPPYAFGPHPVCPEHKFNNAHYPVREDKLTSEAALREYQRLNNPTIFCSPACALHFNLTMALRANNRNSPFDCLMFNDTEDINSLRRFSFWNHPLDPISHPCLPELDRLQRAMMQDGFDRVKWYDTILDAGEVDDVFRNYQLSNRKRLVRFNLELNATCSPKFDFPPVHNNVAWGFPVTIYRTIITRDVRRTCSISIQLTTTEKDIYENKPLMVKIEMDINRKPTLDTYVRLRRACVLLLAQGWNYFDVIVEDCVTWDVSKLAASLIFGTKTFGLHCINVVTTHELTFRALAWVPQIFENPHLIPEQLRLASPFLWRRGVKTTAIVNSITEWHSQQSVAWETIDVAKEGLSKNDCPEVLVSSENKPSFMNDGSFAIWTISNGIKTGTCYSSGIDIVGANHCTLGNTICLETPAPSGNPMGVKRAQYVNKIAKSYEAGDTDMHNSTFVFAQAKKGEIYATLNPAQRRGRWLMCTAVAEFEPSMQSTYNKFVPVNVNFANKTVEVAPYKLYKGLSGAPIISSKGAIVGTYGLSTNIHYQDSSLAGVGRDTTLCHSMVADNTSESEGYFVQAAAELCAMEAHVERKCYLEAPTGTGKSTLFPLAVLNTIVKESRVTSYNVCMLEPTRAAVHNCYERILTLLNKQSDKWNRVFSLRLATGKRGQMEGEHHKSQGNGKIQLCVMTYGRFIAEYRSKAEVPHSYQMLLMDEIHTRSKDVDVATAYLLSGDTRTGDVKVCYMTATSVGRVCETRLCEGRDLQGTRYKIAEEFLIETRKSNKDTAPAIITDSAYFTIDLKAAKLNLKTSAQYVSWPRDAMNGGRCLVFLPSRNDCEKFVSWCRQNYQSEKDSFVSLHAGSSVKDLNSLPQTAIIGCTDFASTAITVPNCKCVVDFMEDWNPMISLFANDTGYSYRNAITKEVVSKQVSTQRKGRTGRTCNGTYFSCPNIHTVEETKLSESMHAQIYFNLLLKMGRPKALRGFIMDNPEFDRIYEHDWLEPDELANRYASKRDSFPTDPHKTAFNRFCVQTTKKLEIVKEWDKDQLWWYLATCVGQDYLDFCFSTENIGSHGFGVSHVKVNKQVSESWLIVDTEEEACRVREDLNFKVDSYCEDMTNFDNYVQRVHDVAGSVSLRTLAKRVEKTSPKMLKTIDPTILAVKSDAKENVIMEATNDVINNESIIGCSLGAVAAVGAIGALCSAGLFAFNHRADWSAMEVNAVEKSQLAGATFTSMVDYCNNAACGTPLDKEPTINAINMLMEWIEQKWNSLSAFFKNLLSGFVSFREDVRPNKESADMLPAILKCLATCKLWLIGVWYKYGAINVSSTIAAFGLGSIYNKMCDAFGIVFANAILAIIMAASSCFLGSTQTAINAITLIVSYILSGLMSHRPNMYGSSNATRAGALLLTAGGGAALSLLLKGAALSKPIMTMTAGPNMSNGLLAMINPYNTGVSYISDGVIIAKMVATLCKKERWGSTDTFAVASTLMSMLFRADAMTCMVSMTAGLFLGFAKVYMSRNEFWFKIASAANIKNADSYKDIMTDQADRFERVFDTILFSAGIIANPMSLVSIVCNIIADVVVAHMQNDGSEILYMDIVKDAAVYHSGVSMIYGMSCAVFKICSQLRDTVTRDWNNENNFDLSSLFGVVKTIYEGFTFDSLWDSSISWVKESCDGFSCDIFSLDFLKGIFTSMWDLICGIVKNCYDWCMERINVLFARTSKKVTEAIKASMPFGGGAKKKSKRVSLTLDSRPPLHGAYWTKAAYAFQRTFGSHLTVEQIIESMKNREGCPDEVSFEGIREQHHYMCGLIGWAMEKYSVSVVDMLKECDKVFGMHETTLYYDSKFWNFKVKLIQYLEKVTGKKTNDIVQESDGRFCFVAGSSSVSGITTLYEDAEIECSGSKKHMNTVCGDSKPPSSVGDEGVEYVITDLDQIIGQIQSLPYDFSWLDNLNLLPEKKDDYENYIAVDSKFWIKERLQDTGDRNIIPLFVQSINDNKISSGAIPNIICDLGSEIYVEDDVTIGSGDYIYGELKRPWNVMALDSIALCKLLSLVGDVSDHGTHVTMRIGMSDKSVIQMSISHSFTDRVANTGLLCQLQDKDTKTVVKDIAAVEIMTWATKDGFKMIATCPTSTAGAWDLLYNNILKYLPFFRDIKTSYIKKVSEALGHFNNWADLAAPIDSDDELCGFMSWRELFTKRRFTAQSYMSTAKSSLIRQVTQLASAYSTSMSETRAINEEMDNPKNYHMIRERLGYSTYYGDFAEAVHNRIGRNFCNSKELPIGIEDIRISLDEYSLCCWFRKLVTSMDVMPMDCIKFDVQGIRVSPGRNLHHPAAYYPNQSIERNINMKLLVDAKATLVKFGYLCGHNVIFATAAGSEISWELAACTGTCRCTVIYMIDGFTLSSVSTYKCIDGDCHDTTQGFMIYSRDLVTGSEADRANFVVNHESDSWIPLLSLSSVTDMYNIAKATATEYIRSLDGYDTAVKTIDKVKRMEAEFLDAVPPPPVQKPISAGEDHSFQLNTLSVDSDVNIFGESIKSYNLRSRRTRANKRKPALIEQEKASDYWLSPGARKMFAYKKDLGDKFFEWLREIALDEKRRQIDPSDKKGNVISAKRAAMLRERYDLLLQNELVYIKMMGEEVEDINDYLMLTQRPDACSEAPWCDGWDNLAIHSRDRDFWLTDGNMHMYHPHEIDDAIVVRDIVRVNKMIDHCPKEVWEECRYKNRMELPAREQDIGNIYASRAACKAQLLYDYLPNFWNGHKVFFEPCCGFGGFAQFFSHQMRNMEPRVYYVSSMNRKGHAQPNWSLMQAANSNCRVVRVMQDVRDGNICDPHVLNECKNVIKESGVTMLLFDIGERHTDPSHDDTWYLAPRTVKGGFDQSAAAWKSGNSICSSISAMVSVLPEGGSAVFKVNTFSMRVTDIIHILSKQFLKVRALKLATTPEMSREFYLFCHNKKNDWSAPIERSLMLKNCVRELTWSAMFRAENMYRTKGRHATRPRTYKWFTPDTSGISYQSIPNVQSDKDELDVTALPNGHAIHIATTTPRGEVKVDLEFQPNWSKRFRCMKDYVRMVNKVSKQRTGRGRDSIRFDNIVRSDFSFVKGIGSFSVRQKNVAEKHTSNDLISSYLGSVAGLNLTNSTYGHTQGTPDFVKPALKRRLDVQPGQPDPTCVIDFAKAVHCLMSEAGASQLGNFRFMSKEDCYSMIVKTGSTGILDPGSTLREFMEIYPEWYELAWEHVLTPHVGDHPTPSYQSVRIKPEPKGRKDVEDGVLQYKKGANIEEIRAGNSLSPRFIQFSDALTRIAHIIAFGHVLEFHGKKKLYKGSINGTPPHIQGRVMRAYWDMHNPIKKRVAHLGNNPELDICIEPTPGYQYKPADSNIKSLDVEGRLGASVYDERKTSSEYQEDLPAGLTIDFSALDSTVTVSERMIMTDLWKRFFASKEEKKIIEGLCRDMTYAICCDDAGNMWVRDGQRGSGEILTSIENTWLVTANIVCALSHALGTSIEDLTTTQGKIHVLTRPGGCGSPKVNTVSEIRKGAPHKTFEFGDIPLLVDGDDVVIISTRKKIDLIQGYMNGQYQWLACNRKVIRSGNKGGATKYIEFEGLSFCSHRYEAVFIGPNASKFNPKFLPRSEGGRKLTRGDILSVAEDNDFKIYFLPIRPVADILSKLMLTLKVKSLKWDPKKTGPGECVDLTQSKIISYLLLYPQCRWVRYTCLTLLCVTGDNLATFTELRKRYRDLNEMDLKHTSKLLGSMASLYGVSSLDDISLREYRHDTAEIRKVQHNTRLTFNVTQVTKAAWLGHSFTWLKAQAPKDVFPLMWDSSVFANYKNYCSSNSEDEVSQLRDALIHTGFYSSQAVANNNDSLWGRILTLVG